MAIDGSNQQRPQGRMPQQGGGVGGIANLMGGGIDQRTESMANSIRSADPRIAQKRKQGTATIEELIALQRVEAEKKAALTQVQAEMQQNPNTIAQQKEASLLAMTQEEMKQQKAGIMQSVQNRQKQAQKNLPGEVAALRQGLGQIAKRQVPNGPPMSMPQGAPQRMYGGGIVNMQDMGQVPEVSEDSLTLDTILFEDDKERRVSLRSALERTPPDSVMAYMQSGNKDWLFSKSYRDFENRGADYQSGQMPEDVGKYRLEILQSLYNSKRDKALQGTKKAAGGIVNMQDMGQVPEVSEDSLTLDTILFGDDKERRTTVRDLLGSSRPEEVFGYIQTGNKEFIRSGVTDAENDYRPDAHTYAYITGGMPDNVAMERLKRLNSIINSGYKVDRTKKAAGGIVNMFEGGDVEKEEFLRKNPKATEKDYRDYITSKGSASVAQLGFDEIDTDIPRKRAKGILKETGLDKLESQEEVRKNRLESVDSNTKRDEVAENFASRMGSYEEKLGAATSDKGHSMDDFIAMMGTGSLGGAGKMYGKLKGDREALGLEGEEKLYDMLGIKTEADFERANLSEMSAGEAEKINANSKRDITRLLENATKQEIDLIVANARNKLDADTGNARNNLEVLRQNLQERIASVEATLSNARNDTDMARVKGQLLLDLQAMRTSYIAEKSEYVVELLKLEQETLTENDAILADPKSREKAKNAAEASSKNIRDKAKATAEAMFNMVNLSPVEAKIDSIIDSLGDPEDGSNYSLEGGGTPPNQGGIANLMGEQPEPKQPNRSPEGFNEGINFNVPEARIPESFGITGGITNRGTPPPAEVNLAAFGPEAETARVNAVKAIRDSGELNRDERALVALLEDFNPADMGPEEDVVLRGVATDRRKIDSRRRVLGNQNKRETSRIRRALTDMQPASREHILQLAPGLRAFLGE